MSLNWLYFARVKGSKPPTMCLKKQSNVHDVHLKKICFSIIKDILTLGVLYLKYEYGHRVTGSRTVTGAVTNTWVMEI